MAAEKRRAYPPPPNLCHSLDQIVGTGGHLARQNSPNGPRARSIQGFSLVQPHNRPWCAWFTLVYKTVNRCQLRRLRPLQRVVDRCNCVYRQRVRPSLVDRQSDNRMLMNWCLRTQHHQQQPPTTSLPSGVPLSHRRYRDHQAHPPYSSPAPRRGGRILLPAGSPTAASVNSRENQGGRKRTN